MRWRSPFTLAVVIAASCSRPAREVARPGAPAPTAAPAPVVHHLDDPDLNPRPRPKLLAIDWATVHLQTTGDALALWKQIAPTGEDWEDKLQELPDDSPIAHDLAVALLAEGNFACHAAPAAACGKAPLELPSPAIDATLADPCLRRLLALWSLAQLDASDLPRVHDALRAIVALPEPESQLVASALKLVPETAQDDRLELLAIAWAAGQHELVDGMLTGLDEAHLATAAIKLHVDGALDALAAATNRATFLAAITDEQLATGARQGAIVELAGPVDHLPADLHTALVAAAKSADCTVAATAARTLDLHGDHALVPKLPHTRSVPAMMRAICVLASFEQQQRADEASYLPGYIPAGGLEVVRVTYDAYADPHTEQHVEMVKPNEVVLPEIDDFVRAMRHCTGTSCKSDDREIKLTFTPAGDGLLLSKLELIDRPPCNDKQVVPGP